MQWSGEHSVRRREDQAARRRPSVILIFAANTRRKPVLVSPFHSSGRPKPGQSHAFVQVTVWALHLRICYINSPSASSRFLTTPFLAEAFGVLRVDASLLVAAGLIEHTPLLEAKGLDGLALDRISRDFTSGTVVYCTFRLASRSGFLGSTVWYPFSAGCGVGFVSLPPAPARRLTAFPLSLGVNPFANAVELDGAFGWRRVRPG